MPPGIPEAKRAMESMAPPQGSTPFLRHMRSCLGSTPRALAKPRQERPLASFRRSRRSPKSSGRTPLSRGWVPSAPSLSCPSETGRVVSLVHLSPPI